MTGNLDMDNNKILKIENLTDHKDDDLYEDIVEDLKSAVNKEYLNEKFLKVDKDGNHFNLKQTGRLSKTVNPIMMVFLVIMI